MMHVKFQNMKFKKFKIPKNSKKFQKFKIPKKFQKFWIPKKFQKILKNSKNYYEIPKIISKKLNYKCIPEIPKVWNSINMKFLKCKIPKNYYEIPKTITKFQKDYEIPKYLWISKIIMKFQ